MNLKPVLFLLVFSINVLAGCTPPRNKSESQAPGIKPSGLTLIGTIEGKVLGRELSAPKGIAGDGNGSIYLIDSQNSRLLKFLNDLSPHRETGGFGFGSGQLNGPTYLAVDNDLNVYISETGGNDISIFDSHLNFVDRLDLLAATGDQVFGSPAGLAVNEYGEIIVADPVKGRLAVFNNVGNFDHFIGGVENSNGYLLQPQGVCLDRDKDILVSDAINRHIEIFDATGFYDRKIGDGILKKPQGLDVDNGGFIWVVDAALDGVYCFDYKGNLIFAADRDSSPQGYDFLHPFDVAVLPNDRLVVSDTGNNRVLVFKILRSQ